MKEVASKTFTADLIVEGSWGERPLGTSESTMTFYKSILRFDTGMIEWDIPAHEMTEHIGLWWDPSTMELTDYDGVFSLPKEAIELLEENGIKVGEDFR